MKKIKHEKESVLPTKGENMNLQERYRSAKERYPDMLILFKMGDFYEFLDTDARIVSPILGLILTVRENTLITGFPHHMLESHLRRLLQSKCRIAICDSEGQEEIC